MQERLASASTLNKSTGARLVLASASPARLGLLRSAGLSPEVHVSGVDETDVGRSTADTVALLAGRKARSVAERCPDALVIGCDSLLDVDGVAYGKPASAVAAVEHWGRLRSNRGTLFTGHCVIDTRRYAGADSSAPRSREVTEVTEVTEVASTVVYFGTPTDSEIEAYVATGEPLAVAGGFTIDGRSAAFVERIEGDPSTVIGLSLPVLRRLLARLGVDIVDLWT